MKRHLVQRAVARCLCCAAAALIAIGTAAPSVAATFTDDFSSAAFDHRLGFQQGIWDGSHNMDVALNNGATFSTNPDGNEQLVVEDLGLNIGWEGGRSTAPMLFRNVPGNQDFRATVKIDSQTSGFWSSAGIIARAADSPTPPGTDADNDDENFVTLYSFRTDAENPDSGNTLMKRIEDGAQLDDVNVPINADDEPLPIWLRLERFATSEFRGYVSTDGVNFQLQSVVTPTAGNSLVDPNVDLEVGLAFQTFGSDLSGETRFDDFVLETFEPVPEPATVALSGLALLGLIGWIRRRRA